MDEMPGRFPPPPDSGPSWTPPPEGPDWQAPTPRGFYPLDISRVFELTFSLFRHRWRTLVGLALLVMVPLSLVDAAGTLLFGTDPDWYVRVSQLPVNQRLDAIWAALVAQVLPLDRLECAHRAHRPDRHGRSG
jgi:hypothetical protein